MPLKNHSLHEYAEAQNNHEVFYNFSLIWMFHSRRLNNKINSINERAPRITYQDDSTGSFTAANYRQLARLCLARVLTFNARRGGKYQS